MPLEFETDKWPFAPAKSADEVEGKCKVRLIVIHSMEAAEKPDTKFFLESVEKTSRSAVGEADRYRSVCDRRRWRTELADKTFLQT